MESTLLSSTKSKRGRKPIDFVTAENETINGLYRKPSGVWRVRATGQEFTEPDERLAVARFLQLQPGKPLVGFAPVKAVAGKIASTARAMKEESPIIAERGADGAVKLRRGLSQEEYAARVRHDLIYRRVWLAKITGVAQVEWLPDLKPPANAPTMAELIEYYASKTKATAEEVGRIRRFWNEFVNIVGIKTLRDLTHELVELYESKMSESSLGTKSVKHRYGRIKTVIAFALKRGKWVEDCRKALDKLAMLTVTDSGTLAPNPIEPDAFWKIHKAALKDGDKRFAGAMLFALNCCQYGSEVGRVEWDDINEKRGEYADRRNKTKVPRVGMLWPEVLKTLKSLPRDRARVFGYSRCTINRALDKHRKSAGVHATFDQLRDAAYSIACRVSADQARVLAGHRMPGMTDAYVLRNPPFVADACRAIHAEFLGKAK